MIWTGSKSDLNTFLTYINNIHPTIKFTHLSSNHNVSFLDISISLKDGFLHSDLFTKPTDSHAYLLHNSCHPTHVKRNLPFSLFLRLRRLCSEEEQFKKRCNELERQLYTRGYSRTRTFTACKYESRVHVCHKNTSPGQGILYLQEMHIPNSGELAKGI